MPHHGDFWDVYGLVETRQQLRRSAKLRKSLDWTEKIRYLKMQVFCQWLLITACFYLISVYYDT